MLLLPLLLGCANGPTAPPSHVGFARVQLPPSAHDYFEYESGMPSALHQARFSLPAADLPLVAFPCELGAPQTGRPSFARVGTNTRRWYSPENATIHRGCNFPPGGVPGSVLVDLSGPGDPVVFLVSADGT